MNGKIPKEITDAILRAKPEKPIRHELGGGYYYKCHWLACDGDINKWFEYCPYCGQKIDWSEEI